MHLSVMVFGADVERQMAPFQETNIGPIAAEHMQIMDVTDDVHCDKPLLIEGAEMPEYKILLRVEAPAPSR